MGKGLFQAQYTTGGSHKNSWSRPKNNFYAVIDICPVIDSKPTFT